MKNQIYTSAITNMKTLFVFIILFFCFSNSFSQYQISHYNMSCVNPGQEYGRAIINRVDNGYAIAGYDYQSPACIGNYDWMLIKLQASGLISCATLIGGSRDDKSYSLVQAPDSGFFLAGYTSNLNSPYYKKATIGKVNKNCGFIGARNINDSLNSAYYQVVRDPSNNVTLTGYDERQITVGIKRNKILASQYNAAGGLLWSYVYSGGGVSTDEAYSICFQSVGGAAFCMAARTNYFSGISGVFDIMLVKTDYFGAVIWKKVYKLVVPTAGNYPNTEPRKIIAMPDGGFAVVGFTNVNNSTDRDVFVMRVNSSGAVLWSNTYSATGMYEEGNSIVLQSPNLIITGSLRTTSPVGSPNAFILKIPDAGGAALWTRVWDSGNPTDVGYDIVTSTTGASSGYAVTGHTSRPVVSNDAFLWRVNNNGVLPLTTCNDSIIMNKKVNTHKLDSFAIGRVQLVDITRQLTSANPSNQDTTLCISTGGNEGEMQYDNLEQETKTDKFELMQNSPNPFNPTTSINFNLPASGFVTMKVYDISGRLVSTLVNEFKQQGSHRITFDGSNLSSGVYYYKIDAQEFTDIKKMILIK